MNENLIGSQIAKYRKESGLTQEELGRTVGVSTQAVSRWECGGTPDVLLLPGSITTPPFLAEPESTKSSRSLASIVESRYTLSTAPE